MISVNWYNGVVNYSSLLILTILTLCHAIPVGKLDSFNSTASYQNETLGVKDCSDGHGVYKSGDLVPRFGPCEECRCTDGHVVCAMIQCDIKPGCKTIQRPNQCCPDYQCDCVHNGKLYNNGQPLDSTLTPCQVCYCRGGALMCTKLTCYTRDDCKGTVQPGSCCPNYDHCPPLDLSRKGNDPIRNTKREMQPWFMTSPTAQPSITSTALPVDTNLTMSLSNGHQTTVAVYEHTDLTTPVYKDNQITERTTSFYIGHQTTDHTNIATKDYEDSMTTTNSDMETLTTTIATNVETEYVSEDETNTTLSQEYRSTEEPTQTQTGYSSTESVGTTLDGSFLDQFKQTSYTPLDESSTFETTNLHWNTDQMNTDSTESVWNLNTSTETIDTKTDLSARFTEHSEQEENIESRNLDEIKRDLTTTEGYTQNTDSTVFPIQTTDSSTFSDQSTTESNMISSVLSFINTVTANMARENSTTVADVTSVITSTTEISEPSTESSTMKTNVPQTDSTFEPQSGLPSDKLDISVNKQQTKDSSLLKERSADFIIAKLTNITNSLIKRVNDVSGQEVQKVDDGDVTDILIESKSKLESSEDIVIFNRKVIPENESKGQANVQNANFRRIDNNENFEIDVQNKQGHIVKMDFINVTLPPDIEEEMLKLSQILLENSEKEIVSSNKKELLSHIESGYKKIENDNETNEKDNTPVTAHRTIDKRNATDDKNSTKSKEEDVETSKNSDSTGGTGLDAQTQQDLLSSSSDSSKNSDYNVNHFEQLETDPISTFTVALDDPSGFTTDLPDNFTNESENSQIDLKFVAITNKNIENSKNKESLKIEESSTDAVTSTTEMNFGVEESTSFQIETTTLEEGTTVTEYYSTTANPTTIGPITTYPATTYPTTTDPITTDPTTTYPTTTYFTTTYYPTTTEQSIIGNLETTTESMSIQTTNNIFAMTTTSTDTNTESAEGQTESTIVGERLEGPTMPSNEWKIEIVPTQVHNVDDDGQMMKTDVIKLDPTSTSSSNNKSPSLRDTSSSEESDSKEDRSGESGSFNAQEIPGLLLNPNFPYLALGGFHISKETKSKNKTKGNLKPGNETENKQNIKQVIKDNQHLIIINPGTNLKESNEEETIDKFATELEKILNDGPPKETTTRKNLDGQQMYRLRDRVGDRLQIATKDILDQIMAEDRDNSDDTMKIMSTRSTKLASQSQSEFYESVERGNDGLNAPPCVECSEMSVDSGVTKSENRNVSPIKLIKFDGNKEEDLRNYGRESRVNSKQTKMISLISEKNKIEDSIVQGHKTDSNFNGKDKETISKDENSKKNTPTDVKTNEESPKETTKHDKEDDQNKISKESNHTADKPFKESNEIKRENNKSTDKVHEYNMDKYGHTLESPHSLFQITAERVDEKAEPKLFYDSEKFKKPPEIEYPEEYPEEFQYINSPPLLIVTTTVYTSVPDVQFVTTQMTNLGLSYDYLTEEYKGDKDDNNTTTESSPKNFKSDDIVAKSDNEFKNETLAHNVYKNETLAPKEIEGHNRSALIRSINDLSLEDESDFENPFETDYKKIEVIRKSALVSLKGLALEDIGDQKDSSEVKNLNNLLPNEAIGIDETEDKNIKSKRPSANTNLSDLQLKRNEFRNKIKPSASLTNNIKDKTKDTQKNITIQKSVTKVVRQIENKRENQKRLRNREVLTNNSRIKPIKLQTNLLSERLKSPIKRSNARRMIFEEEAEWLIPTRPTREGQSVNKMTTENIDAEWITPRDVKSGRRNRERGRETESGRGNGGRNVPTEEQEAEWITPRGKPKTDVVHTRTTTENTDAEWIAQPIEPKRTQSRRIPQEAKRFPQKSNTEDAKQIPKDKPNAVGTRVTMQNIDAEWIPQTKQSQSRRIPQEAKRFPQVTNPEDGERIPKVKNDAINTRGTRKNADAEWIPQTRRLKGRRIAQDTKLYPQEEKTEEKATELITPFETPNIKTDAVNTRPQIENVNADWIPEPNLSQSKHILQETKRSPLGTNGTSLSIADDLNKYTERTPKHIIPQSKPKGLAKIVNRGRTQEKQDPKSKNVGDAELIDSRIQEGEPSTDPAFGEQILAQEKNQTIESGHHILPEETEVLDKAESRTISRTKQETKQFPEEANTQDGTYNFPGADSLNKDEELITQPMQPRFQSFPQEANTDTEWIPTRILPQDKPRRVAKIVSRRRSQGKQFPQSREVEDAEWSAPPIQERPTDSQIGEEIKPGQENEEIDSDEQILPQEIQEIEEAELRPISKTNKEAKRFPQETITQDWSSLSRDDGIDRDARWIAQPKQLEGKQFPQEVNTEDMEWISKRIQGKQKTTAPIVNRGRSEGRQFPQPQPKVYEDVEWIVPPIPETQPSGPASVKQILPWQKNQEIIESGEQISPQDFEKAELRTIFKTNDRHRSKKPTDETNDDQPLPGQENEEFENDEQILPEEIQEIEHAESITIAKTNRHRSRNKQRYSRLSQEYPQEALNIDLKTMSSRS
uniref:VWFC domain-containing protein n=1 Tax=Cacopsylla melanoneura TaxID=428564 RepID=A0A8D8YJP8_9HEMI